MSFTDLDTCIHLMQQETAVELKGWDPVNRFNHTSWVAVVAPTGRPKSVRNRCAIEVFMWRFCVVTLLFGFFCKCGGFCHRTESDLFLILKNWLRILQLDNQKGWVDLRIFRRFNTIQTYRDLEEGDGHSLKWKWRDPGSNPEPLAPQAKSLTTPPDHHRSKQLVVYK